jgi:hypothetical protein
VACELFLDSIDRGCAGERGMSMVPFRSPATKLTVNLAMFNMVAMVG